MFVNKLRVLNFEENMDSYNHLLEKFVLEFKEILVEVMEI